MMCSWFGQDILSWRTPIAHNNNKSLVPLSEISYMDHPIPLSSIKNQIFWILLKVSAREWTCRNGSISPEHHCRHYLCPCYGSAEQNSLLKCKALHSSVQREVHWQAASPLLPLHVKLPSLTPDTVNQHNSQQSHKKQAVLKTKSKQPF